MEIEKLAGRDLKELFSSFKQADELAFRRAATAIIEEEEAKHHVALARDLRKILASGETAESSPRLAVPPPVDSDHGWELAEVVQPAQYISDLVLTGVVESKLIELAKEVPLWARLESCGVPRRNTVLMYGPPGCGKTSAAAGLAAELGIPFVVVRVDAIVSSYLGQTSGNLRRIFDYAAQTRCVLLFDEFDALARSRDDTTEHGELKRVVSSFLQLLDSYEGPSILVAATNHEEILDRALWRRFSEVIEFRRPTIPQIRALLRKRLRGRATSKIPYDKLAADLKGLPHAAVEAAAIGAIRSAVLDSRVKVTTEDVRKSISTTKGRPW